MGGRITNSTPAQSPARWWQFLRRAFKLQKTMKSFLTLLTFMTCIAAFGQSKSSCRVDIYLVKNRINCWDTTTKKIIPFQVTKEDLQDTPFIKNEEIILHTFRKFRSKVGKGKKVTARLHSFQTSISVNERIDSLHLSLFGCAKQFAIVCDGEIIYGGCLNNRLSSWVPPTVVLTGRDNSVSLSFYPSIGDNDPREDKKLFDCLKNSSRFKYSIKYEID